MLKGMTLDKQFEKVPETIIGFYEEKIGLHQKMIDMATALASGPKPGVDYQAMVADAPKASATLEYIDRSLSMRRR